MYATTSRTSASCGGKTGGKNRHIFDLGIATKKGKDKLISDPGRGINV